MEMMVLLSSDSASVHEHQLSVLDLKCPLSLVSLPLFICCCPSTAETRRVVLQTEKNKANSFTSWLIFQWSMFPSENLSQCNTVYIRYYHWIKSKNLQGNILVLRNCRFDFHTTTKLLNSKWSQLASSTPYSPHWACAIRDKDGRKEVQCHRYTIMWP